MSATPPPDDRTAQLLFDFFDNAAVGLHWQGVDGTVLRANRAALDMLGLDEGGLVGHPIRDFHEDAGAADALVQQLARGETLHSVPVRLRRPDGTIVHALTSANSLWEDGRFVHARCFTRDISLQTQAQQALQDSERRKGAILDASLDAILTMDHRGLLVDFNRAAERIFGYSREQALGQALADLIVPPELRDAHRAGLARYLATGEGTVLDRRIEVPALHADGRRFPVELSISRVQGIEPPLFTGTLRDISERRQAEEKLRHSEELLRATFEQVAVGIAIAGLDGRLLETNPTFRHITGYSPEELRRLTPVALTHPEEREATAQAMRDLLEGRIPHYALEKRYMRKDGRAVWTLATVTLVRDAAGRPLHFIGVIEDVDERKRTQQALLRSEEQLRAALEERKLLLDSERAARSTAERMSEMKDEFLATLSHELRTPLSAILGWVMILRRSNKPEDLPRGLDVIERNARVQTQLIDELLDTSRITAGKVRLDVQPVDPLVVVQSALETVRPAAQAKDIRMEQDLAPGAGLVSADPGRLQQVVWNLLTNAIKFTAQGGRVQVVLRKDGDEIAIAVADTGAGIAPDFLPHVFERFRQADASTTRRHGGLGLGLAIVRTLVEQHGGSVQAHSDGVGRGATFTVRLPLVHAARAVRASAGEPARPATSAPQTQPQEPVIDLQGVDVLVVDDEPDARDLAQRVLGDCGARVRTAASAADALLQLDASRPHVLVSDIGMPDVDGFELMRRVRRRGAQNGGNLPALALTAFARTEDRDRALAAGFQMHLRKPMEPAQLVAAVAQLAGRKPAI